MSIISPIIRMCAVAALRECTWAEERVYDSDNTPLADALKAETNVAKPYIVVYTDEDNRGEISGLDVYASDRSLLLILEIGVASAITVEGTDEVTLQIPGTDASMELAVDIVEGQAIDALFGNPTSVWGELFRRIVLRVEKVSGQRGGSAEQGTRWAARQVAIMCDVISDPPPGIVLPLSHPVRDFIAAAKAAPASLGLAGAGEMIEATLTMTAALSWQQAQAWLALTAKGVRAIGVAPPLGVDEEVQLAEGPESDIEAITELIDEGVDEGRPGTGTIREPGSEPPEEPELP